METAQRNRPSPQVDLAFLRGDGHAQARQRRTAVELAPDMPLRDAGRAVLAHNLKCVLSSTQATRHDLDREALHEMRVSTRRLSAAVRDFRTAFRDRSLDPFNRDIRWLGRLLGRIRDLDVLIEWLQSVEQDTRSEMRPYVRRIIEDRDLARVREHAGLVTALDSPRFHDWAESFSAFISGDGADGDYVQDALVDVASAKIERQLRRLYKDSKNASLSHPKRLHKLRIACKRLRYSAEFFEGLYADRFRSLIKQARTFQDDLGLVHDATVHIEFLKHVRRTQSGDIGMRDTLSTLIKLRKQDRENAYRSFKRHFKKLDSRKGKHRITQSLRGIR